MRGGAPALLRPRIMANLEPSKPGVQLHIATINSCNAACHFCVYATPENTYPRGVMDMDLYRKIIDDAQTIPEVTNLAFSALGEPLLDRFLVERVRYAKLARPDWHPFELYTNGTLLTPERFEALKDAGIEYITVSLNAATAKQHEKIMGLKGKYGTVVSNARYAVEHADGKVDVVVKAVRDDDRFREADGVQFLNTWGNRLRPDIMPGNGQIVMMANWAGKRKFIDARKRSFDPNSCCFRALTQFSVLWDGVVSLCCFDPLAKHKLGDLKTQTIREVYNSPEYMRIRETHYQNRAAEIDICAKCTRV